MEEKIKSVNPKVINFMLAQSAELEVNCVIKGDWETFTDLKEILWELEYHKAKLFLAMKSQNKKAIKEYLADMANELLFIGNAFELYDEEPEPKDSNEQSFISVDFGTKKLTEENRMSFFSEDKNDEAISFKEDVNYIRRIRNQY